MTRIRIAEIAQLVEHNLAKVGVAGPSPVFRSIYWTTRRNGFLDDLWLFNIIVCPGGGIGRRARFRCVCRKACRFESCSGHKMQKSSSWRRYVGEVAELVDALL